VKSAIEISLYVVLAASLVFGVLFTLAIFPLHLMVGGVNRIVDRAFEGRTDRSQ
jgi:hypothetical protein